MSLYQSYLQTVEKGSNTPEWWSEIRKQHEQYQTVKSILQLQSKNQTNRLQFKKLKEQLTEITSRQTKNDMFEETKKINDQDRCEKEIKAIGVETKENTEQIASLQKQISFVPENNEEYQQFCNTYRSMWDSFLQKHSAFPVQHEDTKQMIDTLQKDQFHVHIQPTVTVTITPVPEQDMKNTVTLCKSTTQRMRVSDFVLLHLLWQYLTTLTMSTFLYHGSLLYLMSFAISESRQYMKHDLHDYVHVNITLTAEKWASLQQKFATFFSNDGRWMYWIGLLWIINYVGSSHACCWLLLHASYVIFCVV